jgi:hypothetical protein
MPDMGDWFEVRFDLPDTVDAKQGSFVLKTGGYYNLILDKDGSPDRDLIRRILATPGAIVDYSLSAYNSWADSLLSSLE